MKKQFSFLFLLTPLALLLGDESLEKQISLLEEKLCEIRDCTVFGKIGVEFAPGKPALCNWGLFVTGDALYWKMFEGGTEFVCTDINNTLEVSNHLKTIAGKSKKVDFDWNWGYRVGATYVFPSSSWALYLNYTSLDTKGKKSAVASPGGVLIPLYLTYTPAHTESATSRWGIDFSTLDLEFGRGFFVSRYLNLKLYAGLRGARINQKIDAHYIDIIDPIDTSISFKNDFFGVGLRGGVCSEWFLTNHLNLCLDASASILRGRFHVTLSETSLISFFPITGLDDDHFPRIVPNVQFYLGLGWESAFGARYYTAFKIGYEAQYWWRQNLLPHNEVAITFPYGKRVGDDLGMHGLTIKGEFNF